MYMWNNFFFFFFFDLMWNNFYPLTKPKYKITLIPLSRKENGGTVGDSEIFGSQDSLVVQLGED